MCFIDFCWFLMCFHFFINNGMVVARDYEDHEICATSDLRLGNDPEAAGNITSTNYPDYVPDKDVWNTDTCHMGIVSCPACQITLNIVELQLPKTCTPLTPSGVCLYGCDHILIYEPDYRRQTTKFYFGKDQGAVYRSQTSRVYIVYCNSPAHNAFRKKFRIEYSVQERVENIEGLPPQNGTFSSLNFPHGYSRNGEIYQYHIHNKNGSVKLSFPDWNMAPDSKITVYISNHTNTNRYLTRVGTGERPFVISSGSDLLVKFETGPPDVHDPFKYMGFRARYEFVPDKHWIDKPYHDCGAYYHSLAGGHIEYDGTTRCWHGDVVECLWVIFRYDDTKYDQLSLRIDSAILNDEDQLEVRRGNNSMSHLISSDHINLAGAEFISEDAFYIKLRAKCYENRHFRAVFASYVNATYMSLDANGYPWYECPSKAQYACHNGRCIQKTMVCDGVNHCGDFSDEIGCTTPASTTEVRCSTQLLCRSGEWYCIQQRCDGYVNCKDGSDELNCADAGVTPSVSTGNGSNHFFSAYHWGTIIPIILICVVLAVIACITVSYYTRRKQRHRRRRNTRRSTASASQSTGVSSVCGGLGPAGVTPPSYPGPDAPPSYEESLRFSPGQGILNMGYRTDSTDYLAQPPPYTPTGEEPLPVRYVRQPGSQSRRNEVLPAPRGSPPTTASITSARVILGRLLQPIVPMYRDTPLYALNVNNNTLPPAPAGRGSQLAGCSRNSDSHGIPSHASSAASTLESRSSFGHVSVMSMCSSSSDSSIDSILHNRPEENRNPLAAHDSSCSSFEGTASDFSFGDSRDQGRAAPTESMCPSSREQDACEQNQSYPPLPSDRRAINKGSENTNNSSNLDSSPTSCGLKQNAGDISSDSIDSKLGDRGEPKSMEDELDVLKEDATVTRATDLLSSGALFNLESDTFQPVAIRRESLAAMSHQDSDYMTLDNQSNTTFV